MALRAWDHEAYDGIARMVHPSNASRRSPALKTSEEAGSVWMG